MKNKSKGFTMVELLAAIAILGLLTVMAFPTMRAIQSRNDQRKYEEYGRSMISAAKLYTDSYADDLFPRGYKNEFAMIKTTDLADKNLLKNIGFTDISCINGQSFIVVAKYGDDYQYCLSMKCLNEKTGNLLYEETNKEGICKTYDTIKVKYRYDPSYKNHHRTVREHVDEIIKSDDAYYAQDPAKFSEINLPYYHQHFNHWETRGVTPQQTYHIGDLVDSNLLKDELILMANHRQYEYTVSYKPNGGTGNMDPPQQCKYDDDCVLRANTFKFRGRTFLDWQDGNNQTYNASTNYPNLVDKDGGNINMSAHWRLNKIYILYHANGGDLATEHLADFTLRNGLVYKNNDHKFFSILYDHSIGENGLVDYNNRTYLNLTKKGHTVPNKEEWNTAANGTGTSYNMSSQDYTGATFCDASERDCEKTLYVNWKPKTVDVTYHCNGGIGGGYQRFTYGAAGQAFNSPTPCTAPGYTQTGWTENADGTGAFYSINNPVSDDWIDAKSPSTVLYAQYRKNILTIYYMANGGTLKAEHGENITLSNDEVQSYGASPYHFAIYGDKVNLANYDNPKWLNLEKPGYSVPSGAEWSTDDDGEADTFSDDADHDTTAFCDILSGDCTVYLYVNWQSSGITCPPGKYLRKGTKSCYQCISGYYCLGGTWNYSSTVDQGLTTCPTGYDHSITGASSQYQCFMQLKKNYFLSPAGASNQTHCPAGYSSTSRPLYYGQVSGCYVNQCLATYTPDKKEEFPNCSPTKANIKMFKWYSPSKSGSVSIRYDMKVYECNCDVDSYNPGVVCDGTAKEVTTCHHTYDYAFIVYDNNSWRNKAYKGKITRNSHVKQVCNDKINSSNSPYYFHSYRFYTGSAADGWDNFKTSVYTIGKTQTVSASLGADNACERACEIKYGSG